MISVQKAIQALRLEVASIDEVTESYSSTVRMLKLKSGMKCILKVPYSKGKYQREKFFLQKLAGHVPVPELIAYWDGDADHSGALLLSYIEGESLSGEISTELAYDIGVLLAQLHGMPMPCYDLVDGEKHDWWQGVWIQFYNWLKICEGHMSSEFIAACDNRFRAYFEQLPKAGDPVVVHFDFRPGNILVKDHRIVGLIDFESARGGSPDVDFTKVKLYIWDRFQGTRESFSEGYESVKPMPGLDRTLPMYMLFNGVGGIGWCITRGKLADPFFDENMEQVLNLL